MTPELQAASERYARHKARTRDEDSPYYRASSFHRDGHYWDEQWRLDEKILASAYAALGDRQPERYARKPFVNVVCDTKEQLLAVPYLGQGAIVRVSTFIREEGT